jgi:glycosyltransferase involved in cell wall biosynthesis
MIERNLYIPLFAPNLGDKTFSPEGGNPGIGGSQFTTIQFGMLFARAHPEWTVVLGNQDPLRLSWGAPNLRQSHQQDLLAFYRSLESQPTGVVLSMSIHFWSVAPEAILAAPGVPVIWSRHPFDQVLRLPAVRQRHIDAVCVGEYQWHSNALSGQRNHFIEEIYKPAPASGRESDAGPNAPPRAVHVSSMVRAKGFLEVARAWPSLKSAIPGITLEVIGGSNLYGDAPRHELIPAEPDFARDILRHIPEVDIHAGRVIFHGTMGVEKAEVLQRCDFAILNPTGSSEAFPATPLECMTAGLPVIASDDYGMADSMRHFPELALAKPDQITDRVQWLLSSPGRFMDLRRRALDVAAGFAAHAEDNLARWHQLLESVRKGRREDLALRPESPFHGSRTLFAYRRHAHPVLSRVRSWVRSIGGS